MAVVMLDEEEEEEEVPRGNPSAEQIRKKDRITEVDDR